MKKIFVLTLLFISFIAYSQEILTPGSWTTEIYEDPFNGTEKSAFTIGIESSPPIASPVIAISKIDNDIKIYLSYFPAGICGNNTVLLKIDKNSTYTVNGIYLVNKNIYMLDFKSSNMSQTAFINELKTGNHLYLRLINQCMHIDVTFGLINAAEKLKILEK